MGGLNKLFVWNLRYKGSSVEYFSLLVAVVEFITKASSKSAFSILMQGNRGQERESISGCSKMGREAHTPQGRYLSKVKEWD